MPGGPEIMVILFVALIVLGPEQLPKAMRTFGSVMAEIRKLSNGFQTEMRQAMNTVEEATSLPKLGSTSSTSSNPSATDASSSSGSANGSGATAASSASSTNGSEVVARNPVSSTTDDRPTISPADRAAG